MLIKNVMIFTDNGQFKPGKLWIKGEAIQRVDVISGQDNDPSEPFLCEAEEVLDGAGGYIIPGLTDLHFHGCAGYDFCDGTQEALQAIGKYEASHGITAICPATMTLPEETLSEICRNAADYREDGGSVLCGIHMEGPFLSEKKKGAQNATYLHKPDIQMYERLNQLSGNLFKIVSIAPEEEGAMEFITELKDRVVLSLAHSMAGYDIAREAFDKGLCHVTHLYNAMPPFHHRDPGVVGAAFDSKGTTVELICDGIHLHPGMIRATIKMFGEDRIIFVSDSMRATGLPDGTYSLGGQEVRVSGRAATLGDGTIAGSVTNLFECMRKTVKEFGIPLETAVRAAAVNPAKRIGIYDKYGSIEPGKTANILLLNQDLELVKVILRGSILEHSEV